MLRLLVSIFLSNQVEAYIPIWEPQPMPIPIVLPPAPPSQFVLTPRIPPQAPTINMQIPTSPEVHQMENPWISLVRTVASVMNNTIDWEREKAHLNKFDEPQAERNMAYVEKRTNSDGSSYIGTWPEEENKLWQTKERHETQHFYYDPKLYKPKSSNGLVRLINTIPPPDVMFLIGDLLKKEEKIESISLPNKEVKNAVPSFPIEKDNQKEELQDDGTIIGLVTSGRWKNIDWTRKILGIDEIPTIEEGNAIAQLLAEDSKAVTQ